MTVRDELAELMRVRSNMDNVAMGEEPTAPHDEQSWQEHVAIFLRTHGPALLEALADAERVDWLQNHAHTVYTSHDPSTMEILHFVAVDETLDARSGNVAKTVRQALDTARRGGG